jgi:hypothetical protein
MAYNAGMPLTRDQICVGDMRLPDLTRITLLQVILPAARQHLKVPFQRASDGTFVQIAALEQLYRVFERC